MQREKELFRERERVQERDVWRARCIEKEMYREKDVWRKIC